MRHWTLAALLLISACGHEAPTADALRARTRGMNVLLVVLDAANARHFSYMGYERETTPNIDRLAADAVVFETAYAQASATPLSMYSMLTSRYPILEEEEFSPTGELAAVIPAAMPTLASRAAEVFPSRAAFLANAWIREELGFHHGFSTFEKVFERTEENGAVPAPRVTGAFADWLSGDPAGPWLGLVHYLEPHEPYSPPEPWASKFDPSMRGFTDGSGPSLAPWREKTPDPRFIRNTRALYDGNLAYVDAEFGKLVELLRARGEWDETIVVVTSDHGEAFWEHEVRGHGWHVYEEFSRVPLVVRVPGLPARRVAGAVELVDLLPTLLDLAGVPVPPGGAAGESLVEVLTGQAQPRDVAFFRNHKNGFLELGVRRGDLKYMHFFGRRHPELYNLRTDPGEIASLAPDPPPGPPEIQTLLGGMYELMEAYIAAKSGTGDHFDPALSGADSLDAETIEALRAIGYFGN